MGKGFEQTLLHEDIKRPTSTLEKMVIITNHANQNYEKAPQTH